MIFRAGFQTSSHKDTTGSSEPSFTIFYTLIYDSSYRIWKVLVSYPLHTVHFLKICLRYKNGPYLTQSVCTVLTFRPETAPPSVTLDGTDPDPGMLEKRAN